MSLNGQRGRGDYRDDGDRSDKRRRKSSDRSRSTSSRRDKVPRRNGNASRRKDRREEFLDQIVSRPEKLDIKVGRFGEADETVDLVSNFFRIQTREAFSIISYRIDFQPDPENPKLQKFLLYQHQNIFGTFIYDNANIMYMTRIFNEPTTFKSVARDGEYFISLRMTGEIKYTSAQFLQVLNLIQRNGMRGLDLAIIKRNFYDPKAEESMPHYGIRIWPGYITSIRHHEHEILMNCELTHKVLRSKTVLHILRDCQREGGDFRATAMKQIVGMTVMTAYNNQTYRVDDISWDASPRSTFETKNGPQSFLNYYRKKYSNFQIRDEAQPLLISNASAKNIRGGQTQTICLIPELCFITGLMDTERKNFRLMKELAEYTRQDPTNRVRKLLDFNRRLLHSNESAQVFEENGMALDSRLVAFQGRRLQQETICLGNDKQVYLGDSSSRTCDQADWTGSFQTQSMYRAVLSKKLKNWYFVYPKKLESTARTFWEHFSRSARILDRIGIIRDPKWEALSNDNSTDYIKKLNEVMSYDPSFIMILVANDKAERYAAIKRTTLCNGRSVPTQILLEKTMKRDRNLMSIATKVAIQVNCKLGGIPWAVDLRLDGIMVVGYDVGQDSVNRSRSYGAMVALLNPKDEGGKFFTSVSEDYNGTQMYSQLGISVVMAIDAYMKNNVGSLPARILIYRDGVGDGDIKEVMEIELKDILRKVEHFYGQRKAAMPSLGFVVVNRRTNTRIFRKFRNGHTNPLPGTVVDDVITLKERYDFYLVSQSVSQGTVAPIYYNVLHDGFYKGRPEVMQQMTFKLCHNYFNWSGTTKIPSVVQYAKKLGVLIGQYMHEVPSIHIPIDKQLFFL